MHGLATDVTGLLVPATWPDVFEALEKNVPSPLAGEGQGEGQGEGDKKPPSDANNSLLRTAEGYRSCGCVS